jgi:hypothetical protein
VPGTVFEGADSWGGWWTGADQHCAQHDVNQAALTNTLPFSFGFHRFLSLIPSLRKHLIKSTSSLPNWTADSIEKSTNPLPWYQPTAFLETNPLPSMRPIRKSVRWSTERSSSPWTSRWVFPRLFFPFFFFVPLFLPIICINYMKI